MSLPRKAGNDKKMAVKSRRGLPRWPHSDGASSVVCGVTLICDAGRAEGGCHEASRAP